MTPYPDDSISQHLEKCDAYTRSVNRLLDSSQNSGKTTASSLHIPNIFGDEDDSLADMRHLDGDDDLGEDADDEGQVEVIAYEEYEYEHGEQDEPEQDEQDARARRVEKLLDASVRAPDAEEDAGEEQAVANLPEQTAEISADDLNDDSPQESSKDHLSNPSRATLSQPENPPSKAPSYYDSSEDELQPPLIRTELSQMVSQSYIDPPSLKTADLSTIEEELSEVEILKDLDRPAADSISTPRKGYLKASIVTPQRKPSASPLKTPSSLRRPPARARSNWGKRQWDRLSVLLGPLSKYGLLHPPTLTDDIFEEFINYTKTEVRARAFAMIVLYEKERAKRAASMKAS